VTDLGELLREAVPDLPDPPDRLGQVRRRVGRRRAVLGVGAAVLAIAAGAAVVPIITSEPERWGNTDTPPATTTGPPRYSVSPAEEPVTLCHWQQGLPGWKERPYTPTIPSGAIRATLCTIPPRPVMPPVGQDGSSPPLSDDLIRRLAEHDEEQKRDWPVAAEPDRVIADLNTMPALIDPPCGVDQPNVARHRIIFQYPDDTAVTVMLDGPCVWWNNAQIRTLTMPLDKLVG
jgi:hypothetical protein